MTARAERNADGIGLKMLLPDGDTAIVGSGGLGKAPWFEELTVPKHAEAEERPEVMPILTLETAPEDPVINGYHLAAVRERDDLRRQMAQTDADWF